MQHTDCIWKEIHYQLGNSLTEVESSLLVVQKNGVS